MFQIRIHGRGGQGVVTAAEMLSVAGFYDGLHAQAFPSFGSERMGAPVVSFCRLDLEPIRTHDPVSEVDGLIIGDPTLLHEPTVFSGLAPDGYVLINSTRSAGDLGLADLAARLPTGHLVAIPASDIGRRHTGRPIANTALLGAFAALTGAVTPGSVMTAIRRRFQGPSGEANVEAASEAASMVNAEKADAGSN